MEKPLSELLRNLNFASRAFQCEQWHTSYFSRFDGQGDGELYQWKVSRLQFSLSLVENPFHWVTRARAAPATLGPRLICMLALSVRRAPPLQYTEPTKVLLAARSRISDARGVVKTENGEKNVVPVNAHSASNFRSSRHPGETWIFNKFLCAAICIIWFDVDANLLTRSIVFCLFGIQLCWCWFLERSIMPRTNIFSGVTVQSLSAGCATRMKSE